MFYSSYVFDQDLSHFDVSKVTIFGAFMRDAFVEVAVYRFLTLPLLAESMFQRAYQFNGDVTVRKARHFKSSQVCIASLTADLIVKTWNTRSATNMVSEKSTLFIAFFLRRRLTIVQLCADVYVC
jgi:Mycoplasma protein of unknown function, DUF285